MTKLHALKVYQMYACMTQHYIGINQIFPEVLKHAYKSDENKFLRKLITNNINFSAIR